MLKELFSESVLFPKASIVIYRFLNVIKPRDQLVREIILYVKEHLSDFLEKYWNKPEMVVLIQALRNESINDLNNVDEETNCPPIIFAETQQVSAVQGSVVFYVLCKCKNTRSILDVGHETVALKRLIHWVLIDGIISGEFRIHIEPKYVDVFKYCQQNKIKQYVLSSCVRPIFDVYRLLSFTDQGNLTEYFHFFNENYSTKSKETYMQLAENFDLAPSSILLITFSKMESKKAARAGYMVAKIRELNQPSPKYYTIRIISDISAIRFDKPICCLTKLRDHAILSQSKISQTKRPMSRKVFRFSRKQTIAKKH